jgi:hypothetical protein
MAEWGPFESYSTMSMNRATGMTGYQFLCRADKLPVVVIAARGCWLREWCVLRQGSGQAAKKLRAWCAASAGENGRASTQVQVAQRMGRSLRWYRGLETTLWTVR